ncbi:MAG: peptidoglycan-binding protein [Ilumatobacteraceae bacterium]
MTGRSSTGRPRTGRRGIAALIAATVVLAACSDDKDATPTTAPTTTAATSTETSLPAGDPTFTFGYVRPGAGLLSSLATAQEAAINLAVADINAAGGVNGGPVQMIAVDESLDGDTAAAVTDLLDQGADMILGPISSTGAKASLEVLKSRNAVACSASATSPELSTLDDAGVLYRTAMPDSFTVDHVADVVSADAEKAALPEGTKFKVSIVARGDDYGISVGNGLATALTARGMEVEVVSYNPRQSIFPAEVQAVSSAKPNDVVVITYGEGIRLVDSLVTGGVAPTSIIGLDGIFFPDFAQRANNPDPGRFDGLRAVGSTGDRAFIDRLLATPTLSQLVFGAQAYDCTIIGALAAQAAGAADPATFGPQIAEVTAEGRSCSTVADCFGKLAAGEDIDYEGVSGGVRFDDAGDPAEVRISQVTFADGEMSDLQSTDLDLDTLRQQEALAAAIFTSRLQQVLSVLGYYSGPIDGQESEELTAAIALLQADLGVPVTGVFDEETDAALRAKHGDVTGALDDAVIGIQQLLTDLGYYSGPIDGVYSAETIAAVRALQRDLGVPETGILDAATLQAAFEKGLTIGGNTPPPTTVPGTTVPPTTIPTPTTTAPITPPEPGAPTILDALKEDGRFTTLVSLLESAGFTGDTTVLGPVTLFAPTDDALAAVDPAVLDALKADPAKLEAALSFHLVDAGITLSFLATLTSVPTAYGEPLTVTVEGSGADQVVKVNDIATIAPEIRASNGIIIPLDGVLVPTTTTP